MSKLNRDKLEAMTIVELKELLQKQGLSTSGNKQSLIDRLVTANPTGAGVFVIEAVSAPRPKKTPPPAASTEIEATTPEPPQLSEAEVQAAAPETTPATDEPATDDAAALITQLKDLVSQAQAAADAAQKAQQAAEDAAASVKKKKDKKGDKKKSKKKKD